MKTLAVAFAVWVAATVVFAAEAPAAASSRILIARLTVIDTTAHTLTYKTTSGDERTATIDPQVEKDLGEERVGDFVTLTVREEAGSQTVVAVKKRSPPK